MEPHEAIRVDAHHALCEVENLFASYKDRQRRSALPDSSKMSFSHILIRSLKTCGSNPSGRFMCVVPCALDLQCYT